MTVEDTPLDFHDVSTRLPPTLNRLLRLFLTYTSPLCQDISRTDQFHFDRAGLIKQASVGY